MDKLEQILTAWDGESVKEIAERIRQTHLSIHMHDHGNQVKYLEQESIKYIRTNSMRMTKAILGISRGGSHRNLFNNLNEIKEAINCLDKFFED